MTLRVRSRKSLPAAGLALYAAGVGVLLAAGQARLAALLVVGWVALAAFALNSQIFSVLAVPGVFLVERLDLGGIDLSGSDALLILATALALPALARAPLPSRARLLLVGLTIYLGLVVVTLGFHPSLRSFAEVFHRAVLVGGSVLIGIQLVRSGRHIVALRLLLVVTVSVSIAAVVTSLTTGLAPAYPLGLHKNFVGSLFAMILLIAMASYAVFDLPQTLRVPLMAVLVAGLLAAQSRGAFLTLLGGLLVLVVRQRGRQTVAVRAVALLGAAAAVALIVTSVQSQLEERVGTGVQHDSLAQRERVELATYELWNDHRVLGVGLKYFRTGMFGAANQAPNNVLNESMAETGIVGTVGFLGFQVLALVALARGSSPLATAGMACVLGRLLHGQVDIYWSAGTAALPWIVAGLGLAEQRSRAATLPQAAIGSRA